MYNKCIYPWVISMNISILLPYKENFSPIYPGAVSLFVKDTLSVSRYKKYTTVFGSTNLKRIFKFKFRQTQFVLGRLNILLNLILLGLFIYRLFNLPDEFLNFEKGPAMFLPIISVVLLALANKAIKKDEALIKSVDRLR